MYVNLMELILLEYLVSTDTVKGSNMHLAKINNGVITEYPLTSTSYQEAVLAGLVLPATTEQLAEFNLVSVVVPDRTVRDAYDYIAQPPQLIDNQWQVTWEKDLQTPEDIISIRTQNVARSQRYTREQLIKEVQWRFERYARLQRMGQPQIDDIAKLDTYVQALADITNQEGWPFNVTWPTFTA
jgi:hypothetical protein